MTPPESPASGPTRSDASSPTAPTPRTPSSSPATTTAPVRGWPSIKYPKAKTVKNRVHLDLITTDFDGESARLVSLGATVVNTISGQATWTTFADPEGNEFDLVSG